MTESMNGFNISTFIREKSKSCPAKKAVVVPTGKDAGNRTTYASLTFKQLEEETNRYARGLNKAGVKKGTRVVLMIKPGIDFFIAFFALNRIGAVLVVVDPGIGMASLKKCINEAEPEVFLGITAAHIPRILFRWGSNTIKTLITLGRRLFWGGYKFYNLRDQDATEFPIEMAPEGEMSAIMFTSGSTGISKGVVYTQQMLCNQVKFIHDTYQFEENDVDLATFPLFALFDVCFGMTAIIPDMDATKPAKADPLKLINAIEDHGATTMFGSPALVDTLSRYAANNKIMLSTIKRVISCGAPARNDILKRLHSILPENAEIFTPYGATEALPVTSIGSHTILKETAEITDSGGGTCVGNPVGDVEVKIIKTTDDAIDNWTDEILVAEGEIGEIVVKGPIVSREYFRRPENTSLAKIRDNDKLWHRMGDLGRIDDKGRLWFYGRKSHRVVSKDSTYYSIAVERIFNKHSKVFRTALAGVGQKGDQTPVICVEIEKEIKDLDTETLIKDLKEIGAKYEHTSSINHFLIHTGFPVDVRHNAKINRETLSEWASEKLKGRI